MANTNQTSDNTSGNYPLERLSYPEPPPEWEREVRIWKDGKDREFVNTVYREPSTGIEFDSKEEVWKHLRMKIKDFDFNDVPEMVSYTLVGPNNNWKVECDGKEVSTSEKALWEKAFKFASAWDNYGAKDEGMERTEEKPTTDVHNEFKPSN